MAERIETLVTAERRLLQDVSHELRSPLARMSFAAELIKTAGDRDAAVARLQKEIQRLTDLVGTLLQVTRTEGDPSTTNAETFLLDDLVHEVAEDCSVEASARGCRITVGGVVEVPVCGDRELLRRAIENIVRNAIRYAPEGSTVDVQLQAIDSTTRITVRRYETAARESRKSFWTRSSSRSSGWTIPGITPRAARVWVSRLRGGPSAFITALCARKT